MYFVEVILNEGTLSADFPISWPYGNTNVYNKRFKWNFYLTYPDFNCEIVLFRQYAVKYTVYTSLKGLHTIDV